MSVTPSSPVNATVPQGDVVQYLMFSMGDEEFAIDIRTVREIIQFGAITVVPMMPGFVRGVINLRGAVVPVIDLQVRFDRPRSEVGKKTCIIIFHSLIEGNKVELGLMVDAVSEVVELSANRIEPPPQFGNSIRREFIAGLGKVGAEFVVIIEPDKALNIEDMALLAEQWQAA